MCLCVYLTTCYVKWNLKCFESMFPSKLLGTNSCTFEWFYLCSVFSFSLFFLFFCRRSKDKNFEIYRSDIKMANHWWSSYLYPVFRSTFLPFYLSIYLFFFSLLFTLPLSLYHFSFHPNNFEKILKLYRTVLFFLNNLFSIRFWISCSLSVEC